MARVAVKPAMKNIRDKPECPEIDDRKIKASKWRQINIQDKPVLPELEDRRCSNLYSESELMRNIADYVTDCISSMGYQEDHLLSNCRISLSGIASGVAVYALAGVKFPEESHILKICVAVFFGLLLALFVLEAFFVRSAFISVRGKYGHRLLVGGHFVSPSAKVVLGIRQSGKELTIESDVGKYFDSDGYMVTDNIFKDLKSLLVDNDCGLTDENKAIMHEKMS